MTNRLKWPDVIVGCVLVVLLGTFTLAQLTSTEEIASRVHCQSNLRQIGQAMLLYANDNRGAYPCGIANIDDPKPVWGTPYQDDAKLGPVDIDKASPYDAKTSAVLPRPNDVTAAIFQLLRTQAITSAEFVCSSTGDEPWDYGGAGKVPLNWSNFAGNKVIAEHLGYSFESPYVTRQAIGKGFKWNNTLGAEYAIAADMNPGTDALLKLTPQSTPNEMRKGNSPNHEGDGQNVLFGDGHVAYESSPFVGVNQDNIYTYGASGADVKDKGGDGIVGAPVGPDDSILLPTAKDVGVVDADGKLTAAAQKRRNGLAGDFKPPTPQEAAAAQKMFEGNYFAQQGARKMKLQITDKQMIASSGPITIMFDYTVAGIGGELTRLDLTAPDTPVTHVHIKVQPQGIAVSGSPYFEGKWMRE